MDLVFPRNMDGSYRPVIPTFLEGGFMSLERVISLVILVVLAVWVITLVL